MDLRDTIRMELVVRRLAVGVAHDRLAKEEKEARKESRQVPRSLRDRLQADINDARANVDSAGAALEAVARFPPLARP